MTQGNSSNYHLLIEKLDRFTRKFYTNQIIRGSLYWLGAATLLFLLYSVLEHNYYFSQEVRKFLFFSYLLFAAGTLIFWIGRPALSLFKMGKRISHEKAAEIIGAHFQDIKDKLLNILQLKRQADGSESPDLVFASINQKTEDIKLIPFRNAIDLSENRRYLRYALPPLLLLLVLLVAAPTVITDSTARIIRNNEHFEREAPFSFAIANEGDLAVEQYRDFTLNVRVQGNTIPEEAYIDINGYQYRLRKEGPGEFSYKFTNVLEDTPFSIVSDQVQTDQFTLEVLKRPNLLSFEVALDYPSYTQRSDEILSDIGDLVVPAGTKLTWDFYTTNTDRLLLQLGDEEHQALERRGENRFTTSRSVREDNAYTVFLANKSLGDADSIRYSINVIPDLYPKIQAEQLIDSIDDKLVYFVGSVSDDYGLNSLTFNYQITKEGEGEPTTEVQRLPLKNNRQFQYSHMFDIGELGLEPGDQLSYYFEVFDNDAIAGSKASRTTLLTYRKPTVEEYKKGEERNSDAIKQNLKKSLKDSEQLQQEMREMREQLLQEKDLEWQNKKELENFLKRQDELQNQLQQAQDMYKENLENQMEFESPTPEQQEKQERLEELFEELMDEELMEMMEKMSEMFEEMTKEEALEMLEQFDMNEEELQKELDRLMELFKKMEVEEEMTEQSEKLQELAEEEMELSEETEQGEKSNEQLQEEQQDIQEQFEQLREEMEKLQEKNEQLERPKNMEGAEEQMDKIEQDMQNSQEQLQKNENNKASESQKRAAERMQQMAQQMNMQMQQGQMEQMQEDMSTLRQLLENLITLSFDQEDNINDLQVTTVNTPRYTELVQDQFRIQDDFKVVEDTLQALSKRVMQIESFITEKVSEVKENLGESIYQLEERKKAVAADHQQRAMTNMNDLALMLSEVMNQMQQQMSTMMPGVQMCDKPGQMQKGEQQGRMPMDKITKGQEQLNNEMREMGKRMENGEKGTSEEFAKMAARQAALRKALRDLAKEKQQRGQGDQALENTIEEMDKIETELVNKQLTNEMLKRQQEILTRLLEAEKAEREREMDNKREAEAAKQIARELPPSLQEYIRKREAEIESFQTVSPALRPYYKFLVEEYYDALKNQR